MRFVEIWWNDHNSITGGWIDVDEIRKSSEPLLVKSLGAIAYEDDKVVSLVSTLAQNGKALHAITILKSDIIKRRRLYTKSR